MFYEKNIEIFIVLICKGLTEPMTKYIEKLNQRITAMMSKWLYKENKSIFALSPVQIISVFFIFSPALSKQIMLVGDCTLYS